MKIGIAGCAGRMGQMLVQEVLKTSGCVLAGGVEGSNSPAIGADVTGYFGFPESRLIISDASEHLFKVSDVVVDFTVPTATAQHLKFAQNNNTSLILGTTGHDQKELLEIEKTASRVVIVKAMNFSIGVNALFAVTEQLSSLLDDDFDIEILEMHHKHKVDAPSGTALALGEVAAKGKGVKLDDVAVRGRNGLIGERKKHEIGFASLRGGEVVGDHTVIFAGENERIELIHKASSRSIFSKGAIFAALWTKGQSPGLYNMLDVLGFKAGT